MRGRTHKALLLFPLLLCLLLFTPANAAEEKESTDAPLSAQELKEEVKEGLLSVLPDPARDALPDPSDSEAVKEAVGFAHLFSLFTDSLVDGLSSEGGRLFGILAVTVLFAAVSLYGRGEGLTLFLQSSASVALYALLSPTLLRVGSFFSDLSTFTGGAAALFVAVFAAGGAPAGAAAAGGGFASFLTLLDLLGTSLLTPLLHVLLALALLGALEGDGGIAGEIAGRISGLFIFLLSTLSMLLLASLAFESSLAGNADSVALRTVKYTLSSAIPVVGGTVSATLGALHSSLSLIKSTLGGASVVVLLSLLFPLLAELFLLRLALSLAGSVTAFLGTRTLSGVLGRFQRVLDLALAAVAILSVLFLLTVGIFTGLSPFSG